MFTRTDWGQESEVEPFDSLLTEGTLGIVAGTKIATAQGWRKVQSIEEGDLVLTFDGGMQPVIEVRQQVVWTADNASPIHTWPLAIPVGALGNREVMVILPSQSVMIESDAAEEVFGDPFALIPASALNGFRGITPMPPPVRVEVVNLYFPKDEIVFANIGALYHCPRSVDLLSDARPSAPYKVLADDLAKQLIELIEIDDEEKSCGLKLSNKMSVYA